MKNWTPFERIMGAIIGIVILLCLGIEGSRGYRVNQIHRRNRPFTVVYTASEQLNTFRRESRGLPPGNTDSRGAIDPDAHAVLTKALPDLPLDPAAPGETPLRWYTNGRAGIIVSVGSDGKLDILPSDLDGDEGAWHRRLRDKTQSGHADPSGDIWAYVGEDQNKTQGERKP